MDPINKFLLNTCEHKKKKLLNTCELLQTLNDKHIYCIKILLR